MKSAFPTRPLLVSSGRVNPDRTPVVPNRTPAYDLAYRLNTALKAPGGPQGSFAHYCKKGYLEGFGDSAQGHLVAYLHGPPGPRSAKLEAKMKTEFPEFTSRARRSSGYLIELAQRGMATARQLTPGIVAVRMDVPLLAEDSRELGLTVVSERALSPALQQRLTEALQDGGDPRIPVSFLARPSR